MNANKQDAGGLPELPSPIGWYRAWLPNGEPVDEFMPGANRPDDWPITDCAPMWSRRAMRAYGELCRAEALQRVSENAANMLAMPIEPGTLELCRAAPAGGECQHEWQPDADVMNARYCPKCAVTQTLPRKQAKDSAPAGSGEVGPQLEMVEAYVRLYTQLTGHSVVVDLLNDYAALLRKLQQGGGGIQ